MKNKSNKWKIFILLIIVAAGIYYGSSYKDVKKIAKEISLEKALDNAVEGADKVKDEIISKAENITPLIEDVKDKISKSKEDKGEEESIPTSNSLNLNLEIPKYVSSVSNKEIILKRTGYTVSYNTFYKNPNWVAWELTREETKGDVGRTNKFVPDPDLPEPRVQHSD